MGSRGVGSRGVGFRGLGFRGVGFGGSGLWGFRVQGRGCGLLFDLTRVPNMGVYVSLEVFFVHMVFWLYAGRCRNLCTLCSISLAIATSRDLHRIPKLPRPGLSLRDQVTFRTGGAGAPRVSFRAIARGFHVYCLGGGV